MTKKRKVSRKSVYNTINRRIAREVFGDAVYPHESVEWNNNELDALLEGFLHDELPWLSTRKQCLVGLCGRTMGAVKTALWKLAGHYTERKNFANYVPAEARTDRTGLDFSERDKALIALSTNPSGIKRGAFRPNWIASILGRDVQEVREYFKEIAEKEEKRKNPLRKGKVLMGEERIAALVHSYVKQYLDKLLKEFAEHGNSTQW